MMNCILLEDNAQDKILVEDYCSKIPFVNLVKSFDNAEDGIMYLSTKKIDLVISDVEMPGLNGFQFYNVLVEKPLIIFQTTHPSFAVDGFDVNAVDFLVKPFVFERFYRALNKAYGVFQKNNSNESSYFFIKNRESLVKVVAKNIMYIEAEENYCYIYMNTGEKHVAIISLRKAEEQLDASFVRVSRNCIVNMDCCVKINTESLQLQTGQTIHIGSSFRKNLEDEYIKQRTWNR